MQIETIHILLWLIPLGFISKNTNTLRYELTCGRWGWRSTPIFAFIVFLPVFLMTVFGPLRGDMFAYVRGFQRLRTDPEGALLAIERAKDPGFAVFNLIIKTVLGPNETVFRFVLAAVHSVPLVLILRKYSEDYVFSVFLFVAFGYHLAWMMNGMRQFLAVSIIFAATPWIIKQDTVKSILCILLAATCHKTALIFLPIIFIVRGPVWTWKTITFSILIVIAMVFISRNSSAFDSFTDSLGYSISAVKVEGDDGVNPIRVLVHAIPMLLSLIFRDDIRKDDNALINMCVNMSVITTGVYLIGMITSGIMIGRLPIYTSLYDLILLPYLIRRFNSEKISQVVYLGSIILFTAYCYIQVGGFW